MKLRAAWTLGFVCCVANVVSVVTAVHAQDTPAPPKGPGEIIKRSIEAREKPTLLQGSPQPADPAQTPQAPAGQKPSQPTAATAPQPSGTATPVTPIEPAAQADPEGTAAAAPAPVGEDPHANMEGAPPLARRPIAKSEPSLEVPIGSIRVQVLDAQDHIAPDSELQLGVMSSDSTRKTVPARTGADGKYVFDNLATGERQAYRINVLYQGAKYSSTPFRLPMDRGYEVVIRRLDSTQDTRDVVLYVGATSLELKDERLRIVQQARVVNIGAKTYVFPEKGLLVKLPKGAVAFQSEEVMTDQHLREESGEGMRITGSIPPGEVTLTWGFDVPQSETTAEFTFDLPWITFAYRVLSDAAPGMKLEVDDMPAAELHSDNGRRFLVTEIMKRVGEQPLRRVHIRLSGIPGPGPGRYIAVGLSLLVIGLGVFLSRGQKPDPSANRTGAVTAPGAVDPLRVLALEKERLIERARILEGERNRGEIGPEFHKDALRELEEQLTSVLYEQQRLGFNAPRAQV
jgi:hypothetical protein